VNCQSYNSTLRLIHTALKYLFQLFENLICRHTRCQQLLQHSFGLDLLCGFRCFGFSVLFLTLQLHQFFVQFFERGLLGFQVCFQSINVRSDRCNFSGSGFLCSLLLSELCSKINGCFYGLRLVLASFGTGHMGHLQCFWWLQYDTRLLCSQEVHSVEQKYIFIYSCPMN